MASMMFDLKIMKSLMSRIQRTPLSVLLARPSVDLTCTCIMARSVWRLNIAAARDVVLTSAFRHLSSKVATSWDTNVQESSKRLDPVSVYDRNALHPTGLCVAQMSRMCRSAM